MGMIIFCMILLALVLLSVVALVKYLMNLCADIRYTRIELERAADWKEYVYWRRELTALYWSVLPGVTPELVHRLRRRIRRWRRDGAEDDGFGSLIMSSVIGVVICSICLTGSTFAWFTASQEVSTQNIQVANYEISCVLEFDGEILSSIDGTYTLEENKTYTVTLTASGSATTGYCRLDFGDTERHTVQIAKDTTISFTVNMEQPATLTIIAQWGTSAREDKISDNDVFSYPLFL